MSDDVIWDGMEQEIKDLKVENEILKGKLEAAHDEIKKLSAENTKLKAIPKRKMPFGTYKL